VRRSGVLSIVVALTLVALTTVIAVAPMAGAGTERTYVVLYKKQAIPAGAALSVGRAGGSLVQSYPQIGVLIARSDSDGFAPTLKRDLRVQGVSATDGFGVLLPGSTDEDGAVVAMDASTTTTSSWGDALSGLQWDMTQIHVPEAHDVTTGDPAVLVGDIDTGLDFTHPDLAANVDFANSVSCVGGVPNQDPAAWMDDNGHGTHTAGTIAADDNGIGIVGVAPDVKIAGIKAGNADGYFFPEAVICSFMWAGSHGIDITNNSYFADPWLFNCRNDAGQRAIWEAERRAIRWAEGKGVVVVAAAGNENIDLSKTNVDTISPDYPPGSEIVRTVTNACAVVPVDVSGVIGVTSDGYLMQKAYYSSYGVGVVSVTAPGGDRRFQIPPTGNGRVLSTFPGGYAYAQGTSMASPHVAGVAALLESQFGDMSAGQIAAMLDATATSMACPANPFDPGPPFDFLATCTGGGGYNSFYGHGQVDALNAVLHLTA